MKKKYRKPNIASEDSFEQTANQTGYNINQDLECSIPNYIGENDDCHGRGEVVGKT